ncbi:hypothetical protein GCM10027036_38100 [Flavihumibacter cheonanensis]|uniref:T9SS type A sorting domain-containing protein n=1 Tax=Flavihumibacter cheonanensis TaxID=1442385 RepID=UPI001EF90DEC|nr:T9SS type A sorting domain-containing protein [Flavihumibacter cheonanensis]MCG7753813.1 T9SS type A sorting domain-containing protein [Flavihumibacter cheonanensis]
MIRYLQLIIAFLLVSKLTMAQPSCTPLGDQNSFGTGNVWIGYVYDNLNFTNYRGFINQGTAGSPNFDYNFGSANGNLNTNGCNVDRTTFSVRFKLRRTFTNGGYRIVVGGDDGYRFSLDGGATWVINNFTDHAYQTTTYDVVLNGSYDLVIEYYENGGDNRVSFNVSSICMGTENTSVYGTGNVWNGYVYDGTNFSSYVGMIQNGNASSPNFDESFGGSNVTLNTSSCATTTETFSVRYRLRRNFQAGTYQFTVGGDDGYRLSLDGGATWIINRWSDQSYNTTISTPINMDGDYDMVLEYYENGGFNRISFNMSVITLLPIHLVDFKAVVKNSQPVLNWVITANSTPDYFIVERSTDNRQFSSIGTIEPEMGEGKTRFSFTDKTAKGELFYYRLKMVDIDRTVTYSKTLTVRLNKGASTDELQVYPTVITSNQVMVKAGSSHKNVDINLVDLSGRVLIRQHVSQLNSSQPQSIDLSRVRLGKGVYVLKIISADGMDQSRKIIIP